MSLKSLTTVLSAYTQQVGLCDKVMEKFLDKLTLLSKFDGRETNVLGADQKCAVDEYILRYESVLGDNGYGMRYVEEERALEYGFAEDIQCMVVCNTWFKDKMRLNLSHILQNDKIT